MKKKILESDETEQFNPSGDTLKDITVHVVVININSYWTAKEREVLDACTDLKAS